MVKNCPKCQLPLQHSEHQKQHVDVCRQCAGMWFEKDEVNRLIEEVNDGPVGEQYDHSFGGHLGKSEHACPECSQSLERYHLLEDFHIEIDVCKSCDGSWIDHEELTGVENSPEVREVLSELNQKVTWKTWLFQMLSQMPVEYNVKPKKTAWVNWSLIIINVLIYFSYHETSEPYFWVLENLAMTPADIILGNEWWTLLSCTFLHGSVMHLVGNMYFLYIIGDNLEDVLGHKKYLLYYLGLGFAASMGSMLVSYGSAIPSVGASGAIAGLFGLYLMWFRHASLTFMFVIYQKKLSAVWFFGIWLAMNIYGAISAPDGVDYGAHLGGFFVGLLVGYLLKETILKTNPMIGLLNQSEVKLKR